jgi:hypothetical protein
MSWGHYYYEEQVCHDTPIYYDEPSYSTTSDYTPFDDVYAVDATRHSCDNFINLNSYSPHSEQHTTPVQGDYTGPFSNPQSPQYGLDNDYATPHGPYNAQATSHNYAAPDEHSEVMHLEDALYHLLKSVDGYPGPSDGHQGPPRRPGTCLRMPSTPMTWQSPRTRP